MGVAARFIAPGVGQNPHGFLNLHHRAGVGEGIMGQVPHPGAINVAATPSFVPLFYCLLVTRMGDPVIVYCLPR